MTDNVIDLLSDDEDTKPKQIPGPAEIEVHGVKSSNRMLPAKGATSFISKHTSDAANGQRRCRSVGPASAFPKHTPAPKRCQSEPHSSSCTPRLTVQKDMLTSHSASHPATHTPNIKSHASTGSTRRTASKACYDCRKQKMRCEYTASSGTSCQRCVRVGRPCVSDYSSAMPVYNPRSGLQKTANGASAAAQSVQSHGKNVSNKRKAVERPEIANKRPRVAAIPQSTAVVPNPPVDPPSVPSTCNTVLWSTPAYQGPDKNTILEADKATSLAPMILPSTEHTLCIDPTLSSTIPATATPTLGETVAPPPRTRRTRTRRTMWTCAQLASLATELQSSFDFEGFATRNNKSKAQVLECFSYLVTKPTLEYSAEGQKIARNFHRDLKEDREKNEKALKQWRRKEGKEVKENANAKTREESEQCKGKKTALSGVVGTGKKEDATKKDPVNAGPVKESNAGQKNDGGLKKIQDVAVSASDKAEPAEQGPVETCLAVEQERGLERITVTGMPLDTIEAEQGKPMKAGIAALVPAAENEAKDTEGRTKGPIETALALEREKGSVAVGQIT